MTTSTTYTCDMCGAESDTSDQFWTLRLSIHLFRMPDNNRVKTMDACRNCAERFGMLPFVSTPKPEEPPSIADLLREVMSHLEDE